MYVGHGKHYSVPWTTMLVWTFPNQPILFCLVREKVDEARRLLAGQPLRYRDGCHLTTPSNLSLLTDPSYSLDRLQSLSRSHQNAKYQPLSRQDRTKWHTTRSGIPVRAPTGKAIRRENGTHAFLPFLSNSLLSFARPSDRLIHAERSTVAKRARKAASFTSMDSI